MRMTAKKLVKGGEAGQSIVESTLSMLVLSLILFGLLQVFHTSVAQMVTNFASFYSARSRSTGFAEYLVTRTARTASVAASGPCSWPGADSTEYESTSSSLYAEGMALHEYLQGIRWLEYQYWFGENEYGSQWSSAASPPTTSLRESSRENINGTVESTVEFHDYPFPLFDLMDPNRTWFETGDSPANISSSAQIMNYSDYYLE